MDGQNRTGNIQPYFFTGCAVVLDSEKRILLKKDPKRGWELPGGHVESHESMPRAVVREVKEETGIDVKITKFCGMAQDVTKHVCHTFWLAESIGGEFKTGEESLDIGFFSAKEAFNRIQRRDFREELQKCLDEHSHPFFLVWNEESSKEETSNY